jgi:hypothetical protein
VTRRSTWLETGIGGDSGGTRLGAKAMDAVVKQRKSGCPSTWSMEAIAKRDWLSETIS